MFMWDNGGIATAYIRRIYAAMKCQFPSNINKHTADIRPTNGQHTANIRRYDYARV